EVYVEEEPMRVQPVSPEPVVALPRELHFPVTVVDFVPRPGGEAVGVPCPFAVLLDRLHRAVGLALGGREHVGELALVPVPVPRPAVDQRVDALDLGLGEAAAEKLGADVVKEGLHGGNSGQKKKAPRRGPCGYEKLGKALMLSSEG